MKSIPASPGEFVGLNLSFLLLTLLLSLCLYSSIQAGSLLLAHGEGLVQGRLEQKIPFHDGKGEVYQIGFSDEQGLERHFYQYHRKRSDRALGSPLYFYMTNEGIVLKSQVSRYGFILLISFTLSLGLSLIVGGMLIKVFTHRIECVARSRKIQYMLTLFKCVMFVLSIVGVISAANRIHTDFFLPVDKANVISITCHHRPVYQVKAYSPSWRTEFEADWHFFNEISPATGQEVNTYYSPNSKLAFARTPSNKVYSIALLCIAIAYISFTLVILIKGRILYR